MSKENQAKLDLIMIERAFVLGGNRHQGFEVISKHADITIQKLKELYIKYLDPEELFYDI